VVKQVVVSNENAIAQHAASSIVLSRSVLQRRLGSSFSPEAGALFFWRPGGEHIFACGERAAALN
jgi:hypothetical protein